MKEKIRNEILSWKFIIEKPNKYYTPSFYVKDIELCHFHSVSQMDIRKPMDFKFNDLRKEPNPYSDKFFHFNFKTKKDMDDMIKIIKRVYCELV